MFGRRPAFNFEDVKRPFSLEALRKPLGFFLHPLKALRKAVEKFVPKRWKRQKKPLGFFRLPVEGLEKSRQKYSEFFKV